MPLGLFQQQLYMVSEVYQLAREDLCSHRLVLNCDRRYGFRIWQTSNDWTPVGLAEPTWAKYHQEYTGSDLRYSHSSSLIQNGNTFLQGATHFENHMEDLE